MKNITVVSLQIFFDERPSLSKRGVEREAELPDTKIKEFLRSKQDLSVEQKNRLQQILEKYGWAPKPKGLTALLEDYSPMGIPKLKKN